MLFLWFLPSTQKLILDRIAKEKAQRILNRMKKRELEKFSDKEKRFFRRGEYAERDLERNLKGHFDKELWHIVENVTLPYKDGTTQIDLVVLSVFGFFVIEVKDFSGHIYTRPGKTWTQQLGSQRYDFQNPHFQNKPHINALKEIMKEVRIDVEVQSYAAFLGEASINAIPLNTFTNIISIIRALEKNTERVLTKTELILAIGMLEYRRKYDLPETTEAHIQYLKEKHSPKVS